VFKIPVLHFVYRCEQCLPREDGHKTEAEVVTDMVQELDLNNSISSRESASSVIGECGERVTPTSSLTLFLQPCLTTMSYVAMLFPALCSTLPVKTICPKRLSVLYMYSHQYLVPRVTTTLINLTSSFFFSIVIWFAWATPQYSKVLPRKRNILHIS
jgi:hypothetical protein